MKVHLGKTGPGSKPVCGVRNSTTSGISLMLDQFLKEDKAWRCEKCDVRAARQVETMGRRNEK